MIWLDDPMLLKHALKAKVSGWQIGEVFTEKQPDGFLRKLMAKTNHPFKVTDKRHWPQDAKKCKGGMAFSVKPPPPGDGLPQGDGLVVVLDHLQDQEMWGQLCACWTGKGMPN